MIIRIASHSAPADGGRPIIGDSRRLPATPGGRRGAAARGPGRPSAPRSYNDRSTTGDELALSSPASAAEALKAAGYLPDERIAQVVFLADRLGKPVLVEGPAGVGKTELAKSMATVASAPLVRLQCYEGLDEAKALYEWNYKKQLLRIQADVDHDWDTISHDIFSEEFLLTLSLIHI